VRLGEDSGVRSLAGRWLGPLNRRGAEYDVVCLRSRATGGVVPGRRRPDLAINPSVQASFNHRKRAETGSCHQRSPTPKLLFSALFHQLPTLINEVKIKSQECWLVGNEGAPGKAGR
jgi:hypothetical protein